MSIIYDALKKVEQSHDAATEAKKEGRSARPPFKFKRIYLLVICLGVLAGAAVIKFMPLQRPAAKPAAAPSAPVTRPTPLPSTLPPPASIPAQEAPKAPEPPEPGVKLRRLENSLVLNGVFYARDGAYALINNQIVRTGDIIDGAKVKRIGDNEVELEFEGADFKLHSH